MTETPTDDDGGPAASDAARSAAESALLLAPHGRRVWAFAFDLAVVGILALVPGGAAAWLFDRQTDASSLANLVVLGVALAAALCVYSTATSWLTGGQTPGKAMLGLAVRRRTGAAPERNLRGLAWVAGRSSVGYIVIDVFGLAMLAGLLTRGRRCLHDYVFGSRVLLLPADVQTTGPEAVLTRLRAWDERRLAGARDVADRYGWLGRLVKWLAWIVTVPISVILAAGAGRWLFLKLAKLVDGTSTAAPSAAPAPAMSAPATAAVATGCTGLTVGVAIAAGMMLSTPSIVGTWDGLQVKRTGADTFAGAYLVDATQPDSGCPIRAGQVHWRIVGDGPEYGGQNRWYRSNDCQAELWGSATFTLDSTGRTLKICSTNPNNKDDTRCYVSRRG
jgi:uncharacterized RDD family membrane protein YckC